MGTGGAMLEETRLAELERLAAAATDLPWEYEGRAITSPHRGKCYQQIAETGMPGCRLAAVDHRNGAFIAASRTAVPELVAEVRRLREHLTDLRAEADYLHEYLDEQRIPREGEGGAYLLSLRGRVEMLAERSEG